MRRVASRAVRAALRALQACCAFLTISRAGLGLSLIHIYELMQIMPGPDFPTGAIIMGSAGIDVYKRQINDYARKQNLLKEKDANLTGDDVREGLSEMCIRDSHLPL